MADDVLRSLIGTPEAPELRLERRHAATRAQVWSALTTPARIRRWLGEVTGDPRAVGDAFTVTFADAPDEPATGEVVACVPEERLVVRWDWAGERTSTLEVALAAQAAGTALVLTHRLAEPDHVAAYGGGWERSLAALATLHGSAPVDPEGEAAATWAALRDRALDVSFELPASPADVWRAFTTAEGLRGWWWRHWDDVVVTVDARTGGGYRIEAPSAGIGVSGTYLVVAEPSRLAFTWRWEDADGHSVDESCDLALDATEDGCRLTLRHTGPWRDDRAADNYRIGWEQTLAPLLPGVIGDVTRGLS